MFIHFTSKSGNVINTIVVQAPENSDSVLELVRLFSRALERSGWANCEICDDWCRTEDLSPTDDGYNLVCQTCK